MTAHLTALHFALAATGATFNWWIPIVAGVLLLGGVAVLVVSIVNRRRAAGFDGADIPAADLPPVGPQETSTPENPAP